MRKDDSEIVAFAFMRKVYFREREHYVGVEHMIPQAIEVKGKKTLKLFRSWFRMMTAKNRLLYGVVTFENGEMWLWQNKNRVYRAGWQLMQRAKSNKPKQVVLAL